MNSSLAFTSRDAGGPADVQDATRRLPLADDKAMLRAAAELTRDLHVARGAIFWPDMLACVAVGYGALYAAMTAPTGWAILAGVIAVLALYRAGSFIHELTHIRQGALPGFRLGWHLLVGIPLMVPSFLYEGVHTLHHARQRYGTAEDPEYLPLALMKPWSLPVFVIVAALAPVAQLLRFAVLAPLSAVIPPLRRIVVERYSALSINPSFRRRAPEGAFRTMWLAQEIATSAWAIALVTLTATGVIPLRAFLVFLGVISAVAVLNQIRTLVAHLWENDGEQMTVTAQYLDSVNVPPPGLLAPLWAPVGLRYHALHHLVPSVPYHALGVAHRRLMKALGQGSTYDKASYPGLPGLVARLARSTMVSRG
ncbi:fatty acid desaturase family protein [Sphingomonas canadensis]|uniref:Fatty acid desaturase family protein n=1 Tax=Sphingomonas canadensis TaxID=1219257 RepID=A0ABW3H3G1_9SPHN|nr:fatty acid desaturase [Sphingomonas canadensis]MCW3835856.1 fatty acid desaturase [Sphingomonas canadensis]